MIFRKRMIDTFCMKIFTTLVFLISPNLRYKLGTSLGQTCLFFNHIIFHLYVLNVLIIIESYSSRSSSIDVLSKTVWLVMLSKLVNLVLQTKHCFVWLILLVFLISVRPESDILFHLEVKFDVHLVEINIYFAFCMDENT